MSKPALPTLKTMLHALSGEDAGASPGASETVIAPRYDVRSVLGRGGMGQVWLCHDTRMGRDVAIKVVNPGLAKKSDAEVRARFLRESRVQGQLEHPAIVPVYDLEIVDDDNAYFAMKRVRGLTLATILDHLRSGDPTWSGRFPLRKLLAAFGSICLAVDFAHSKGVIHRDIKPQNIMLGDFGEVYLLDWGVAKVLQHADAATLPSCSDDDGATGVGNLLGTPGYMAPEQIDASMAPVGPHSDVYALGAVLFEIVSLRRFIETTYVVEATIATLQATDDDRRPSKRGVVVSGALDDICARALARHPADRFASARVLHDAIDQYLAGENDLARRRELSRAHLDAANASAAHTDEDRASALRELGSALALDPENADARRALFALLTSTPSTMPPDVTQRVADDEDRRMRTIARMRSRRAAMVWLPFVPFCFFLGMHDVAMFVAAALAVMVNIGINSALARVKHPGRVLPWVAHLAIVVTAVILSAIAGPFIIVPGLLISYAVEHQMHPRAVHRWGALLATVAALAIAFGMQLAGIVEPSYHVGDEGILIRSHMIHFGDGVLWFFFLSVLATILAPSWFSAKVRTELVDAERRLHLHAWQLTQIVPPNRI